MTPTYAQSAVVPFRGAGARLEVLLVTNLKGKRWVLPKGLVEPDLSPAESAAKEAWEEAGLEGELFEERLGTYRYEKWGGVCVVEVFPLRVTGIARRYPEAGMRELRWFDPEEAARNVREEALRRILGGFPAWVEENLP